jgi:hypothetical protein
LLEEDRITKSLLRLVIIHEQEWYLAVHCEEQSSFDLIPVDEVPPRIDVFLAFILEVEIISPFPYIANQNGYTAYIGNLRFILTVIAASREVC